MNPSQDGDEVHPSEQDPAGPESAGPSTELTELFDTIDPLPDTVLYRDYAEVRPSVKALIQGTPVDQDEVNKMTERLAEEAANKKQLFGMFEGVFARCLLNIWGVLMFLRLGWIVGHAGILHSLLIIACCMVVTVITTTSLSAICTNGEVKSGGAYFMISRSLGPNYGGVIGILFSLANAGAVALHLVGFAEQVVEIYKPNYITGDAADDRKLISALFLMFLIVIALVGVSWVIKFQLSLLALLTTSIVSYIVGTFTPEDKMLGYTGYSSKTFSANLNPDYHDEQNFVTLFALFFPAATGIMAGANISGDLKEPGKAIPKGTLLAVFVSGFVYVCLVFFLGATVERSALDPNGDLVGLRHNYQIMVQSAMVQELIVGGIFAAGLSSALAALVGAPRVFQAVSGDGIFPVLRPFAKGRGPNNEPVRAYVLTFMIAMGFIALGEINAIAPLITNFFMISYALINYACFAATDSKAPGWRPSFKYFNKWVAFFGMALCILMMFIINWAFSLVTGICTVMLYTYVARNPPDVNWGSARAAHLYIKATAASLALEKTQAHVKTYRPTFLVLTPEPESESSWHIYRFVDQLTQASNSVFHVAQVILNAKSSIESEDIEVAEKSGKDLKAPSSNKKRISHHPSKSFSDTALALYLEARQEAPLVEAGLRGYMEPIIAPTYYKGWLTLLQTTGVGKLRPNTVLLSFPDGWKRRSQTECDEFLRTIRHAFELGMGVSVLRKQAPVLELPMGRLRHRFSNHANSVRSTSSIIRTSPISGSTGTVSIASNLSTSKPVDSPTGATVVQVASAIQEKTEAIENNANRRIDVWWMSDDGGLTVLLPYLLRQSKEWRGSKMRVITGGKSDLKGAKLLRLLERFRIDAEAYIVDHLPQPEKADEYRDTWKSLLDPKIYPMNERSKKCVRIQELLLQESSDADIIFMSLPVPHSTVESRRYLAWLDLCSSTVAPVVLVRGTEQVITYYS